MPLCAEKGLYSSFVFTGTTAVSQGTTGTFTKIRKALMPKSESRWVGFFFGKESSARSVHGLKEQGGTWVPENRSHFYTSSKGSSNFLPLSRVSCRGLITEKRAA